MKQEHLQVLFSDTEPKAAEFLIMRLRETPPWRKSGMMGQLNETVRILTVSRLRQRHPGASEMEIRRRLVDSLLGPELANRVYGPIQVNSDE